MNRLLVTFVYVLAFSSVSLAAAVDSTSVRRDSIYKQVDLGGVTVEGRTAIQPYRKTTIPTICPRSDRWMPRHRASLFWPT